MLNITTTWIADRELKCTSTPCNQYDLSTIAQFYDVSTALLMNAFKICHFHAYNANKQMINFYRTLKKVPFHV